MDDLVMQFVRHGSVMPMNKLDIYQHPDVGFHNPVPHLPHSAEWGTQVVETWVEENLPPVWEDPWEDM